VDRYKIILKKPYVPKRSDIKPKNYKIYEWAGNLVWREEFKRANKEHVCEKCGAAIFKGRFYKYTTLKSKTMNAYQSFKLCLSCAALVQSKNQLQ
jgi:hypothetical protein